MVEGVEKLRSELELFVFRESRRLEQGEVSIADSRTAANGAGSIPDSSQSLGSECIGVKELIGDRLACSCAGPAVGPVPKAQPDLREF